MKDEFYCQDVAIADLKKRRAEASPPDQEIVTLKWRNEYKRKFPGHAPAIDLICTATLQLGEEIAFSGHPDGAGQPSKIALTCQAMGLGVALTYLTWLWADGHELQAKLSITIFIIAPVAYLALTKWIETLWQRACIATGLGTISTSAISFVARIRIEQAANNTEEVLANAEASVLKPTGHWQTEVALLAAGVALVLIGFKFWPKQGNS